MKYVLVKYKDIKLLINEGCDSRTLLNHLSEIEKLFSDINIFYRDLLKAPKEQGAVLEKRKIELTSKIGYKITGSPFTNHDAELYALNENLNYDVLELTTRE